MSEREQEQFEAQRRVRSFFAVFSCGGRGGDGPGELEVSRANFFLEEESFRALGTLSQAKSTTAITSKDAAISAIIRLVVAAQSSSRNSSKQSLGELLILTSVHSEKRSF